MAVRLCISPAVPPLTVQAAPSPFNSSPPHAFRAPPSAYVQTAMPPPHSLFCPPMPLSASRGARARASARRGRVFARRAAKRPPGPPGDSAAFRKALQRPPGTPKRQRNPTPLSSQSEYSRCMQLASRRDKRPARAAFRAALAAAPNEARLWLAWAQMEARCGRVDEAREVFRAGLVEDPNNVRLIHAWAVEEDRAGRPADAAELFRQCLDIDPSDGIVWQSYALCEERAGNTPVARAVFQQGVEADPTNAYLWSAWGVLEQRHGRLELACDLFEKAVRLNPQHVRTFQAWAITKEKMGLHAESEALFRRALDVSPRSAPTLQAYGLFEARRGNLDRARDLFETGIQADPNHAPIWHAWAVMEQREKNYDTARELFDNGVNAAPNSTPMLRAWASMELELGHIDKSRDWMVPPGSRNKWKRGTKQRAYAPGKRDRDKSNDKQISAVGKNLQMLRLMIERRSDEDVKAVMQWLSGRARADRRLADAISERRENDSRRVTEWIERRSTSDIKAFKEWLDDRYEKDSRIGVYIFNWDIPLSKSMSSTPVPVRVSERRSSPVEKPVEWLRLSEEPSMGLQAFDDQLFHRENPTDYGEGIYFMGQIAENLADRAALVLVLSAMTFGLIGVSVHLFDLGYSPSGQSTQTGGNIEGAMSKPSGVDAILYEEGGAESVIESKLGSKKP